MLRNRWFSWVFLSDKLRQDEPESDKTLNEREFSSMMAKFVNEGFKVWLGGATKKKKKWWEEHMHWKTALPIMCLDSTHGSAGLPEDGDFSADRFLIGFLDVPSWTLFR